MGARGRILPRQFVIIPATYLSIGQQQSSQPPATLRRVFARIL